MSMTIDWGFWRLHEFVKDWQAAALSIPINPDALKPLPQSQMAGTGMPNLMSESFADDDQRLQFEKRLALAQSFGRNHWLHSLRFEMRGEIHLAEFAAWLIKGRQAIPLELEKIGVAIPVPPTLSELARRRAMPIQGPSAEEMQAIGAKLRERLAKPGNLEVAPAIEPPILADKRESKTTDGNGKLRHDAMDLELEIVLREMANERITAGTVMPKLRERAGRPDSCVTECAPDGVIWDRGYGDPDKLTVPALKERLRRRKAR